jgi:hypothetical protein
MNMRPTGHIRQRSAGSFEIRYSLGTNSATGKRRIATATVCGTRRDAERELRRLLRTLDTGEHVDPTRMTVREWLTTWLAAVREEVSPKTHERYSEIVENFLVPELGALPITKLSAAHIQAAYTKQRAGATVKRVAYPRGRVVIFIASLTAPLPAPSSNKCWHVIRATPSESGCQRSSAERW